MDSLVFMMNVNFPYIIWRFSGAGRYPRNKGAFSGIMLGRGLLASPWLATEFVSGQVLTVNERRDKLVMFHESLMDEYAAGWKVASIRYYLK